MWLFNREKRFLNVSIRERKQEQPSAHTVRSYQGSIVPNASSNSAIETLTSKQRAHLRSLAHHLKPVLHIGKDGVNDSTISAAREAFNTRELMKVKVLESAPGDARETAERLVTEVDGARIVQIVGHTAVLYRPDPDHPEIRLP